MSLGCGYPVLLMRLHRPSLNESIANDTLSSVDIMMLHQQLWEPPPPPPPPPPPHCHTDTSAGTCGLFGWCEL
eukprot:2297330-Prymnesium_polylepis.1